jgi:hypothetical protein
LGATAQAAQKSNSPLFSPDVISILSGSASAIPVTYNAAGLIESVLQAAGTSGGASGSVTAQALTALLARNFTPSAPNGADALTANQNLARLLAADPNSAATGMDANAAAAKVYDAAGMLRGLPSDSATMVQNSLLSYELGRAAAAGRTGTAATTASGTDATLALKDLLLTNTELTVAAKAAAAGDITDTAADTSSAVSTIRSTAAAAPAVTSAAGAIAATTAAAASSANADAASIATTVAVTGKAGDIAGASSALTSKFLLDSTAQALANIQGNAAYANAVSGLYMSAAIFRAQPALATELNTADRVQSVSAVPIIFGAVRNPND